ncbi:MAG: hypothetical protein WBE91_15080 [Steroidobacteraceae bacterium]
MPRWMAAHPHLSSRLLAWTNAYRYRRWRTFFPALLIIFGLSAVAVLPPTGPILGWLGRNWAVTFVIAASIFTLSTARRRQHASIAAATSWLASLPTGIPVRMQVIVGTAARLAAFVAFAALVWVVGAIDRSDFSRLALAATAGAAVGLLGGWRLPRTGIGAPGFHYAIVRRARARWASAPSLLPLGNWPAAQGRIFSRPKKTAPIVLLAMMAIPSGVHGGPGQAALAVAGFCMALYSVISLSAAAVRVAFDAARWLAPTTVGKRRFTVALNWRVMLTQILAMVVLILLTASIDLRGTLAVGVPLVALYLCASLAVASVAAWLACHRAGVGTSARGV